MREHRTWMAGGALAAAMLASGAARAQMGPGTVSLCADGGDTICSVMPEDVTNPGNGYTGLSVLQSHFDYFAWQAFLAVNWPAGDDGAPLPVQIGSEPTAPRVWMFLQTPGDVFAPDGPTACPAEAKPVFDLDSKIEDLDRSTDFMEAFSGPLIDANGNFAVYDVRVSSVWYDYVHGAGLDTWAGQQAFSGAVDFPIGEAGDGVGAMEIKSAWLVVPDGQEAAYADHFTVQGYVGLEASETSTGESACLEKTLALVGMHVIVRTRTDGEDWIWGTFEHKRTAPFADSPIAPYSAPSTSIPDEPAVTTCTADNAPAGSYTFFNASCTDSGKSCAPNVKPQPLSGQDDYLWNLSDPTRPYAADYLTDGQYGTQATRCWAIYSETQTANATYQEALAGTVWANYELMGTQWQHMSDTFPAQLIVVPAYLANATMETYFQTTASCLSCHTSATLAANSSISANFSWLLNRDLSSPSGETAPVPEEFRDEAGE